MTVFAIRGTVAVVRSLLDELDRLPPSDPLHAAIAAQLADELARLGGQLSEWVRPADLERRAV